MESLDAQGHLVGWRIPATLLEAGYAIGPEHEDVFEGQNAARIDSRHVKSSSNSFGNLIQSLDATPYREKRVRFRAAVKVTEAAAGAQAQMWLRVDLASTGGARRMGFFDNMEDRPIRAGDWQHYDIVGDVASDAQSILLGVMTFGACVVSVDEATLEVVGVEATPTGTQARMANAPTQPFFTWWLVLPSTALALFALGLLAQSRTGKFAFEFTFVYWTLYTFPTLLSILVPMFGDTWGRAYEAGPVDAIVRWVAAHILGIQGELVSPFRNGSGDTTHSYVEALVSFVLALVLAALWSLVDRRSADHRRLKDFLCSALRYYLAATLMGYGLSKIGVLYNQFPAPGRDRLAATYGSSSPMGLLWTFMGSSRAYTAFSGSMEMLSALLLVWRRTALLGALASVGVMLNVMLLNFCYDVPVKLFSLHLLAVGLCLALPHAGRLAQLFVGLGSGAPSTLAFPFTGKAGTWIHRALKAYLGVMVVALPLFVHFRRERALAPVIPTLGDWKLATLEIGGEAVTPGTDEVSWLTLTPRPTRAESGWTTQYVASLAGGGSVYDKATLTAGRLQLAGGAGGSRLIPGDYAWTVVKDELRLEGAHESAAIHATFVPAARDYLLMRRGFRWINERPYNR